VSTWIPVLVRIDHLDVVTRLIADLEVQRLVEDGSGVVTLASVPAVEGPAPEPELLGRPSWSESALRRLANGTSATAQRWTSAMDLCAGDPGSYLPTSEVARLTGMTITEWRDAPRKITRHLKAHFSDVPRDANSDLVWPLHASSRPEYPGEVSWAITPEMATLWKRVRGGDD
jgi:hypothetical protein